jgi:hypothetical protein
MRFDVIAATGSDNRMHCHNVVHEDHAMMVRWDLVGHGFLGPKRELDLPAHLEGRPGSATVQKNAKDQKP